MSLEEKVRTAVREQLGLLVAAGQRLHKAIESGGWPGVPAWLREPIEEVIYRAEVLHPFNPAAVGEPAAPPANELLDLARQVAAVLQIQRDYFATVQQRGKGHPETAELLMQSKIMEQRLNQRVKAIMAAASPPRSLFNDQVGNETLPD